MKRIIILLQLLMFLLVPFLVFGAPECGAGYTPSFGTCVPSETGLSNMSILSIASGVLSWLLGIFGALAIIAFIVSGIQYLTSAGDEKALETAKRNMKWSIIGVIVGLSGLIVIQAVSGALQGIGDF